MTVKRKRLVVRQALGRTAAGVVKAEFEGWVDFAPMFGRDGGWQPAAIRLDARRDGLERTSVPKLAMM